MAADASSPPGCSRRGHFGTNRPRSLLHVKTMACGFAIGLTLAASPFPLAPFHSMQTGTAQAATAGQRASSAPLLSTEDTKLYADAFAAADKRDWKKAYALAARAKNKAPGDALRWLDYQDWRTEASFSEISTFLMGHPDWPYSYRLRENAERNLKGDESPSDIVSFFDIYPPVSSKGVLTYLAAADGRKNGTEFRKLVKTLWVDTDMAPVEERDFRKRYKSIIDDGDDRARMERLLWEGKIPGALRQARLMPSSYRKLAEARIALRGMRGGVDGAIARVPEKLQDDPGLVYERLLWRRKKGRYDEAGELLLGKKRPDETQEPELWWRERSILSRELLAEGKPKTAYRLASEHGPLDGYPLAESEWLSGWIALRSLNKPDLAFKHFKSLFENVRYPVSRARGAYWAARASEAAGEAAIARQWYEVAASHMTTFYGQMAALSLPEAIRPSLPDDPTPSLDDIRSFEQIPRVGLIRMLSSIGARDVVTVFTKDLNNELERGADFALVARLAKDIGRNDLAVDASREAIKHQIVLGTSGYPMITLDDGTPSPPLVMGLVRQESGFDEEAQSPAGARGLMQLMPSTAKHIARKERIAFDRNMLTEDPTYNLRLGSSYLSDLLERFGGSLPMTLAAYNAGPARVNRWIKDFGNPGADVERMIDWIESIPYYETRNYVQRVIENITVYRQRIQGSGGVLVFNEADTHNPN